MAADETGVWEALIGGPRIEHAHATVMGTAAAAEAAMSKGRGKVWPAGLGALAIQGRAVQRPGGA
jgi:hypothetical protein